jgi:D-alanyl-D-alanine carboxypeptidase/D-alanyl-D-alanine-endopeptidase (penicillin-binding protein 4)
MKKMLLASLLLLISHLSLAASIDDLLSQYLPHAHVGLLVQDADSQKVIYGKNRQQGFAPASVTKSFLAAATMVALDPNFSYQTKLGYNQDDLVIIFSGDPSFTQQDLIQLLQHVKTAHGDIIIDNTYFPKPEQARGWVAEDLDWYFGTPAKTVIIDENQIPIKITPSKILDQNAQLKVISQNFNIPLTHNVKTVSEADAKNLCQLNLELNPDNNGVHFYGCWPTAQETTLKVSLANPELRVKQIILETLKKQNIAFSGEVKIAQAQITQPLATHQSAPLSQLNLTVMQKSNNLYADSLLKVLGKHYYDRATMQAGSYAMLNVLKDKLEVNSPTIRLSDGSGGSIYNQVTPQDIALLLQKVYSSSYQSTYLTMQKVDDTHTIYQRLPKNFNQPLYVKTGSMTGVSNMAGYIKTKSGKTLIFVSLLNSLPQDKTNARNFETALIHYLAGL